MQHNFSYLQEYILKKLQAINTIETEGIYTHVPSNNKFPYIHLGQFLLKDLSCKTQACYLLFFSVSIYSRQRNYQQLFAMADAIKSALMGDDFLVNLQFISHDIEQKTDGVTSVASLKFKILLGA
jgi:hypothetical protein